MKYKLKTPVVLDVSRWQGNVKWDQISPRPILVICKASEGVNYIDPTLAQNWTGLKALNIRRGAYHYFHADQDAAKQFANYEKAVAQAGGFQAGDLPPVLDVEGLEGATIKVRHAASIGIKTWLDKAQAFSGRTPIIYTSQYQWSFVLDNRGGHPEWASNYPLWVAWYPYEPDKFSEPAPTAMPVGWKKWAMWQYSKEGRIDGLDTIVDLDIIADWFASQLDQQPVPPPGGTPPPPTPSPEPSPTPQAYHGTVIAPSGVNVRTQPNVGAKIVGALVKGTSVHGKSIKVISPNEAWLELREPMVGWCAIAYNGTTLITIKPS